MAHRFKLGVYPGKKEPLDFLCTHSVTHAKPFPQQILTGKCIPKLPSPFYFPHLLGTECLQLQKKVAKEAQTTSAGFVGHRGQVNDPGQATLFLHF